MQKTAETHTTSPPAQEPVSAPAQFAPGVEKDRSTTYILALACLWLVFLVYPFVGLFQEAPPRVLLALAGLAVFFGLYFRTFWRLALKGVTRPPWGPLMVMEALGLALPLLLGAAGQGLFIYTGLLAGFTLRLRPLIAMVLIMAGLTVLVAILTQTPWWETVALTTTILLGSGMASAIRHFREMNQQLRAAHRQVAALAASEERLRLARELHDSVKQQVFVISMEIGAVQALFDHDRSGAKAHVQEAASAIRQLRQDLKALVQALRPALPQEQSLAQAVLAHSAAWAQRTRITAPVSLREERPIPRAIEQELFRVMQEALTNVEKHSAASQVTIALTWHKRHLQMRIADNGRGFIPQDAGGGGYGLLHMRERVAALGGTLQIASGPGTGTTITCLCPLPGSGGGSEHA